MSGSKRYPYDDALAVARDLVNRMKHAKVVQRVEIAGSLRRRKPTVGDIELIYIPETIEHEVGLFGEVETEDLTLTFLQNLQDRGILEKRLNVRGGTAYGEKNKLMVHVETGIPVDLFATTEANWWNYLVCRTGGSQSNIDIAKAANDRGWNWNPYSPGFSRITEELRREVRRMNSEEEVFAFVGLPYLDPSLRN